MIARERSNENAPANAGAFSWAPHSACAPSRPPVQTPFGDAGTGATAIAQRIVKSNPDRATLEHRPKDRLAGTIYVDAQQRAEGKRVVAV